MSTIIVTGSAGLIGSETVKRFAKEGAHVVGIDNDMRAQFFGAEASTNKMRDIASWCERNTAQNILPQ
jgi:CDP-paratose 2-epimerase